MKLLQKIDKNIFIFLGLAILILWQMLLPGYILTLDMIFAPKIKLLITDGAFYNTYPVRYLLHLLNFVFTGWIIQKIILLTLFFVIGYISLLFISVPRKHYANYWAALFYTLNPFVYERFLAGHWTHLFAYAFLPPLTFYLVQFYNNPEWRSGAWLFAWLFAIGLFSTHFVIMAGLLVCVTILIKLISYSRSNKNKFISLLKISAISGVSFLIASAYWLVPYLLHRGQSVVNTFSGANWEAFKTAGDVYLGTSLNVLALYGFWGERENWAGYWLWPKDHFLFWLTVAMVLAIFLLIGVRASLKNKEARGLGIFYLLLALVAFIFSVGIGDTIFKNLNLWLFEHIGFWRGFRDTQKFSAWLVLAYAYFGGFALVAIMDYWQEKKNKFSEQILWAIFLLPILYTYPMVGGFARQLQPVDYPQSWYEVNEILNQDKSEFKVLYLPWHQYLSLDFNNNLITANPARAFFDKEVLQGENMEIGGIFSQTNNLENAEIEKILLNTEINPDQAVQQLFDRGVKYLLISDELLANDYLEYKILDSSNFIVIYRQNHLTFLKLAPKI
ncbi:hypothetical protein L6270_03195 [Candidatus Parcubacteria bacterium]|nr:hypothetical protein [Patescibacteria group bacterium]MBU4308970.1 hypothetical protein [Patescibacteria group bacterium]MBU4431860.1 hypothetical protein [Patescibacteria group bacterium]MBU4577330.1 hypothetical protein [Patescibacteria group bacterium]MCG2697018.1 hypothetical protein [Candidatus Parcubacteria bacterium]